MTTDLLHAPNSDLFSDSVIAPVVPRRSKSRRPPQGGFQLESKPHGAPTQYLPAPSGGEVKSTKPSTAEEILHVQRWRRRITQQRYRKKIDDKATTLAKDVDRLRDHIQELETQRCLPVSKPRTTPWKAVVEYFRLFRYGRGHAPLDEDAQLKFLQEAMAPGVASNRGYGVEAIIMEWELLSSRHESLELRLLSLDNRERGAIVAHVKALTTITERTLRNSLAPFDAAGAGAKWKRVAWKLLGQQIAVPGRMRFEWDGKKHQFVSVFYKVDILTSLLKLLGTLEDASMILNSPLAFAT